jgi:predicted RNase H-like nuclease (RuvC/YqgF family)
MERLYQQIQAQMGELESVRVEYANAQLECNAADERSQILASEVISLEDKALRLRSNELKLERELEKAQTEMLSYKKKLQSLEKDRQDLQSTIKALQEEKKVLQTMVQKASSGGKSTDLSKNSTSRKNVSTSTEGLAISDTTPESSNQETDSTTLLESDSSNTAIIPETRQLTLEGFSLSVPADQMRVIHNINTLIAELAIEKEELVQALSSELSRSAHVQVQ